MRPPKSSVASVVETSFGVLSPLQPSGLSGSASGAVKDRADTTAGAKPTPSSPRIIDTAWYRCVEET